MLRLSCALAVCALAGCQEPAGSLEDAALLEDASPSDAAEQDGGSADAGLGDAGVSDAGHGDPLSWALEASGPFHAGYRTFSRTYRPAGQTEDRVIRVHVWYPTQSSSGPTPRYEGLFADPASFIDAPLAPPVHAGGRYPLHVYSHGHQGLGGGAAFLHRHLASHGWVTVAPDHTGNTLTTNIDPRPVSIYYLRSLDVTEAIDMLDDLPSTDPLAGLVDTTEVLLTGHSFGSQTVWGSAGGTFDVTRIEADACSAMTPCSPAELDVFRAGLRDPRIVVAAPLAGTINPSFFGEAGHESVTIPIFAMSGGADNPSSYATQWDRVTGIDFTWVEVADACHEFFNLGLGCPAADQVPIVGRMILALGRRHLLDDSAPGTVGVLDGSISVSPRVTLMKR